MQHHCKNDKSSKTEETLDLWKGNRRIHQAVFADVLVLGEVASLRCVGRRRRPVRHHLHLQRFERTDYSGDEVVLVRILQVLLDCLRGPAGTLLSDQTASGSKPN